VNSSVPSRWSTLSTRQAFLIHLAISTLIFLSLVAVMVNWWFPGELFFLDGGWQGLKLVALVDLVLGPALTLLLYKPGKPKLLLDMSLVALFQISALAYGFYATHQQRVIAVVYADRNFNTLSADAAWVASEELKRRDRQPQQVTELDTSNPAMLLTPEPKASEFAQYMDELLGGFPETHERLDLMVKRDNEHREFLSTRAIKMDKLELTGADELVLDALNKGKFEHNDIEFHHFRARYAKGIALYSISKQEIVDYVPIDWDALIAKKTAESEAAKMEAKISTESDLEVEENSETEEVQQAESVEQ